MSEKPVIVYVEPDDEGNIMPLSLECITMGRELAGMLNAGLAAFVIGSGIEKMTEELSHYDIDDIYAADNPIFGQYQPDIYVAAFESLCRGANPGAILMGNSLRAIDLAPRAAFRLNIGLVTDCTGIKKSDVIEFIKPVYSSNIMAAFTIRTEPYMATVRTRAAEPASRSLEKKGRIVQVPITFDGSAARSVIVKSAAEKDECKKLQSADIVVAGGRGIGGPGGFKLLSEIADVLDAGLGASRPPCDLGWINPRAQVGQTGEMVGPSVYMAVGISGSTQHIAGMSSSKVIIAVNKDTEANIFRIADYGAVGRYEEILPAFMEMLKNR